MTNKEGKRAAVQTYLDELLPNAKCELEYTKDYELVIAVMLSAQTTDKAVNRVTKVLFTHYPTVNDLKNAKIEDIINDIKSLGLANNKAKNIIEIARIIVDEFDGTVPQEKEKLLLLPGVGNKTANVIRAELFAIPEFAVDTHVERVSKRLKLAKKEDQPIDVEKKLRKYFLEKDYIKLHHQFIHFGRYYCKSQKPLCTDCKLKEYCQFIKDKK